MKDEELTALVLEGLRDKIKEQSFKKEIESIDREIQEINNTIRQIETMQRQYVEAKATAVKSANTVGDLLKQFELKMQEVRVLSERAQQASNLVVQSAKIAEQKIDFDSVLAPLVEKLKESQEIRAKMNKVARDIGVRKEELKRAGIDVDMAAKSPSRIQL